MLNVRNAFAKTVTETANSAIVHSLLHTKVIWEQYKLPVIPQKKTCFIKLISEKRSFVSKTFIVENKILTVNFSCLHIHCLKQPVLLLFLCKTC